MHRILTIARLTWKAAFRYRLFWVMAALLAAAVVGLPLVLKDDGTAKGLTQILLTYTLSAITVLLGSATLWLSCGTLARDVEECQMQMVITKPIARWQVWLGKWAGILALNAMLLALSGAAVFLMLQWRSQRLSPDEKKVLEHEIFVARAPARERVPDLTPEIERLAADWRKKNPAAAATLTADDAKQLDTQIAAAARSEVERVDPGTYRLWLINLSRLPPSVRQQPMQMRVKFHVADPNPAATYQIRWRVGPTNSPQAQFVDQLLPPDSFQETILPPLLDANGNLCVICLNANDTALFFPMEDGFEILYRENSFGVNFARGLAVILCWLALLSAVGLASASFLSFPVAAFCSLAILLVGLSTGTLNSVQEQKSIFSYTGEKPPLLAKLVDNISVPIFVALLKIINLVESFSPVDALSTGHSVTWGQLARAVAQIVFLMGGLFCLIGILLFNRRELAATQSNS
jgi:hypothetical protein